MIATNGEKLEHLRVTQNSASSGCVQIDLSNRWTWTPYRIKDTINAPKANGLYLVSMKYAENPKPITYILYYDTDGEYWVNSMGEDFEEDGSEVFAWRALPAPYNASEERK